MKRVMPFALVAMLSMFTLGSCDKLLETFFPEETLGSNTSGAEYSIAVDILYDRDLSVNGFGAEGAYGAVPIKVALVPFDETYNGFTVDESQIDKLTLWKDTFANDEYGDDFTTRVTFTVNRYCTYKVLVWFDENPLVDWPYDAGRIFVDPGTLAYRDNNDYWVDFRYDNPRNAGIEMSSFISYTSVINTNQLEANPYAVQETGGGIPTVAIYNAENGSIETNTTSYFYPTDFIDPDGGWDAGYSWVLYKWNYNAGAYDIFIASGTSSYFEYMPTVPDEYFMLTLVVTDSQGDTSATVSYYFSVYTGAVSYTPIFQIYDGSIMVGLEDTHYYTIPTEGVYYIRWENAYESSNGSYTAPMSVSVYDDSSGSLLFENYYYGYSSPISGYFPQGQILRIVVTPYDTGKYHMEILQ